MNIFPISYQPKVFINNIKKQSNPIAFKGVGEDTFVKETTKPDDKQIKKAQEIFEEAGILNYVDKKTGLLEISGYNDNIKKALEKHQGVTEDDLFKTVGEIYGSADFTNTDVENLGNLEKIGGCAHFKNSKVKNLGNLRYIRRYADFEHSNVESLGYLDTIGDDAYFKGSKIKTLGKLQSIGGDADFEGSNVEDLGELKSIEGNANFKHSKVKKLGNLEYIGGVVYINDSPLTAQDFSGIDCFIDSKS